MITAPANWPTWAQVLAGLGIIVAVTAAILAAAFGLWLLLGGAADQMEAWREGRRAPQERANDEQAVKFATLDAYDSERARGIAHTPEWDERMATLRAELG